MKTLPNRQPDKIILDYIKVWNENGNYVIVIDLKDGNQVIFAEHGKFEELKDIHIQTLFRAMLKYYASK